MNALDWIIVILYITGMIGLSIYLSRGQTNMKDYYLAGNSVKWWQISLSTMATQCSTNSLLGAPAFVGLVVTGGLIWLQYELAVPFAMIFIMIFLMPFYRKAGVVSIYEYLELRFGIGSRTVLSSLFQLLRAVSTGITVWGISSVIAYCLDVNLWVCVFLVFIITIIYDSIGGMKGVIVSDVIQMIVLVFGVGIVGYYATVEVGGFSEILKHISPEKLKILDFKHTGLGDGQTFAFWPMLFGGFFLYVSYYGCDQTQVQRELSSKSIDDSRRSLFMNGILRYPLVLLYCFVGLAIGAFAVKYPEFVKALPLTEDGLPNNNMAVPVFVFTYLPHGMIGLIIVALFSAAMSSLDSTINSLSAITMKDLIEKFTSVAQTDKGQLFWSKITTVVWGVVCTGCVYLVDSSGNILSMINEWSSILSGPIMATFLLAIFTKRANDIGVVCGILLGLGGNVYMKFFYADTISFWWWNIIGFVVTFGTGYLISLSMKAPPKEKTDGLTLDKHTVKMAFGEPKWRKVYYTLGAYFLFIVASLYGLEKFLT